MAITFKRLSYVYSPDMPYATRALDSIDLSIDKGKITAIIGKTGSGKSTLVQHLNALLLPSFGTLEVDDYVIKAGESPKKTKMLRKLVGLVFQFSEYQLFEETILKDVAFGPKNFGLSEIEANSKAKEALRLVGISKDYYDRSPFDISGGQKRRVAIAGILALEPDIIVLDEPTAGLDPRGTKEMIKLFRTLNQDFNKTIILVTHDDELVYDLADDVVLLQDGKVCLKKTTSDFFSDRELLEDLDIIKPKIIELKDLLADKGIIVPDDVKDIKSLVDWWQHG